MLPALLMAYPEATFLTTFLLTLFGAKKLYDNHKDEIPSLFSVSDSVINSKPDIDVYKWSDDTKSTKEAVFNFDGVLDFGDNKSKENIVPEDLSNVDDYVLRKLQNYNKFTENVNSDVLVKNLPLKEEQIDISLVENSSNLLDVLKNNNISLIKAVTSLVNSVSSVSVVNSIAGYHIYDELRKLNSFLNLIPISLISISKNLKDISDNDIVSVLSNMTDVLSKKELEVNVSNNFDIKSLVDVLNTHLSKVAEAKNAEKEYYDYLKTPTSYKLTDEALPNLSPREVMALSEAIKAHLNSQEATITAEDLGLEDYDIDFGDVLGKLFNFEGISKDIEKFNQGGNDGS